MPSCDTCKVEVDAQAQLKSCVCKKASYCSKECQLEDWKNHKPSCPPFTVRESPGNGRRLFATRRIKEGQIILDEYPFLTLVMSGEHGISRQEFSTKYYSNIGEETKAKIFKLNDPNEVYRYRNDDPYHGVMRLMLNEPDEMTKMLRIFLDNMIAICADPSLNSNYKEHGLYDNISLISHSCLPNAVDSWVMGDFKRHQVRALLTIEKEEEIVLSLHQNWPEFQYASRWFRREQLLIYRGFLCRCSVCSLEGEALEENERLRAEIREKKAEIGQLLSSGGSDSRRSVEKAMKAAQQKANLMEKLKLRLMFVSEMVMFHDAASDAKKMGISAPDPEYFKQEALKYARRKGDASMYYCNQCFT